MNLRNQIETYVPFNEEEGKIKEYLLKRISFEEAMGEDIVDFIRPVHKRLIEKLRQTNNLYKND